MKVDFLSKLFGNSSVSGNLDVSGTLSLKGAASGSVGLKAKSSAGSAVYALPNTDGANNDVLTTDGSGNLAWSNKTGGVPGSISSINGDSSVAQTLNGTGSLSFANSGAVHTATLASSGTAGTSGYLAFWSGANALNADSGLFWDNTNKRIGIGTVSPATALDLGASGVITTAGGTSTQWNALLSSALEKDGSVAITANWDVDGAHTLYVDKTHGKIGIGTTNPISVLQVSVPFAATDTTARGPLFLSSNDSIAAGLAFQLIGGASQSVRTAVLQTLSAGTANAGNLALQPYGGIVGIGTTSPATALDLGASGVITTAGGTSTQWNALLSAALKADGSVHATASLFFYNATIPATEIGQGYLKLNNTSDGSLLVNINQSNNTMPTHLGYGGNVELTDFDNFSDHTLSSSMLFFKRKLGTSDPTDGTLLGSILASSWNTNRSGFADGYSSPAVAINFVQDGANGSMNTPGMIKFCTATNASLPLERMRIDNQGHVFLYNLRSGTSQASAGAAAHEVYIDTTNTNHTLCIGV